MTYRPEFVMKLNAEYEKHKVHHGMCRCAAKLVGIFRFLAREAYIIRTRKIRNS